MMTWVIEGIGVAAVVLSALFITPQALRAVRHGSAGIATTTFQMIVALATVWTVYGVVEGLPALVAGNVPVIVGAVVVLVVCRRDGAPWRDLLPVSVGCLVVGVFVWFVFGPEQIGWIAAALGVSMRVPQLRAVRTAPDVDGVSAATWWLGIANNCCWLVYGLAHGDIRIPAACTLQILLAATLLRSLAIRRQAEAEAAAAAEIADASADAPPPSTPPGLPAD